MSDRLKNQIRVQVDLGAKEGNEGRTRQEFADEANINKVLGKWRRTGFTEHVNLRTPLYGDFSEIPDRQEAMNRFIDAQNNFDALPARIRAMCENDPEKLLERLTHDDFREALEEFGVTVDSREEGEIPSPDSGSHPEGAAAEPMAGEGNSPEAGPTEE